jgi:hypothetical protein
MTNEQPDLRAEAEDVARRMREDDVWVSYDLRIKPDTAAYMLGIKPSALSNRRYFGKSPRAVIFDRKVTYFLVDVLAELRVKRAA